MIKSDFEIYGALERIEIFCDDYAAMKFAHVTFKENRVAYFALVDYRSRGNSNIEIIRPADLHRQPDNPVNSTNDSPFYNLNDDYFVNIVKHCDFESIAALSVVCSKFSNLIRTHIFGNKTKFTIFSEAGTDGHYELETFSHLLNCMKPNNFHLKIYSGMMNGPKKDYFFAIDMNTSKTEFSIESSLLDLEVLHEIQSIAKRINCINIHHTIYDSIHDFDNSIEFVKMQFPNVKMLTFCGYSTFDSYGFNEGSSNIVDSFPNVEMIFFRNLKMDWYEIEEFLKRAISLREISFEECLFETELHQDVIFSVTETIKERDQNYPLCIRFNQIQVDSPSPSNYYTEDIYAGIKEVTPYLANITFHPSILCND